MVGLACAVAVGPMARAQGSRDAGSECDDPARNLIDRNARQPAHARKLNDDANARGLNEDGSHRPNDDKGAKRGLR